MIPWQFLGMHRLRETTESRGPINAAWRSRTGWTVMESWTTVSVDRKTRCSSLLQRGRPSRGQLAPSG